MFFFDKSHHRIIINNYKWGNVIEITEKLTNKAQRYELFRVMVIFNWVWGGGGEGHGKCRPYKILERVATFYIFAIFLLNFVQ